MFFYLLHPLLHVKSLQLRRAASFVLILMFAFGTFSRATAWANPFDFAQAEFTHHPDSIRANIELGYVYDNFAAITPEGQEEYYLLALERYEHASQLDPNDIAGLSGLIMSSARRGRPVKEAWVKELSFRLEHAPYAANASDKLHDLTICHLKGECRLPSAWVGDLLDAALRNRTVSGRDRAKLLYVKSSYLINVRHDYAAATAAMYQMVESAPNEPSSRFVLIDYLTAMRYFEKAQVEINKAHALNMRGTDAERLAQLERQLADSMGKPTTAKK
jgi:tetratricopeptide (TPR) repeat protein